MTFGQMQQRDNEAEVQNDFDNTADLFGVPVELITTVDEVQMNGINLVNPNVAHQDEPVDPVTE